MSTQHQIYIKRCYNLVHDLLYCKQIYVMTGDEEACNDLSDYDESLESLSEDDRNDTGKT